MGCNGLASFRFSNSKKILIIFCMASFFLKKQVTRIMTNYVRMILSFFIGLVVIRHLTQYGSGLYSTYVLVVVGLGFGVMIKEIVRAATIPFIGLSKPQSGTPYNYAKCLSFVGLACVIYGLVLYFVISVSDIFNVNEVYVDTFTIFVLLRGIAHMLLIMQIPALNVFAINGEMGLYNIIIFLERLGELVAVELVYFSVFSDETDNALLINGGALLIWNIMLLALVSLILKRYDCRLTLNFEKLNINDCKFVSSQFFGNSILVLNMALYFRFSIILINIYFGEALSSVYGLATQLIGYLRQATMGLITGIDSHFSRTINNNTDNVNIQLFIIGEINSLLVVYGAVLMHIVLPFIVFSIVHGSLSEYSDNIISLANLLLIGVVFRSLSEHWMSYMTGAGKVREYSSRIFYVSLSTPIVIFIFSFLGVQNPLLYLAYHYSIAMLVSHMVIIPNIISRKLFVLISSSYKNILMRIIVYSLILYFVEYLFNINEYNMLFNNAIVILLVISIFFALDTKITYNRIIGMQ